MMDMEPATLRNLFYDAILRRGRSGHWSAHDAETGEHVSGIPMNEAVVLDALVQARKERILICKECGENIKISRGNK